MLVWTAGNLNAYWTACVSFCGYSDVQRYTTTVKRSHGQSSLRWHGAKQTQSARG